MPEYLIIHRPENPKETPENSWSVKQGEYENKEEAIRGLLTHFWILEHEYVVYEVTDSTHSVIFHNDGTFDDIAEGLGY